MTDKAVQTEVQRSGAGVRDIPAVPAVYMRQLLELGQRWGAAPSALVHNSGLTLSQLERADARVSSRQMGRVAHRVVRLTGHEDVGLAFGMDFRPHGFGQLGNALMACPTLGEALAVVSRYRQLILQDMDRSIDVSATWITVTLHERYDLGPTRRAFYEALLVMLYRYAVFLTARHLPEWHVCVDWEEPSYFRQYGQDLGPWAFSQPSVQIRMPVSYLSLPLFMADQPALERALEGINLEMSRRERLSSQNVVAQVRALLRPGPQGFPDLETIAATLCVSPRSLNRRLGQAGTHFQLLLDEARCNLARNLLTGRDWPLQQISNALGFSEPAAFTRAFRRWTGSTPSDFRRASLAESRR